MEERRTEDPGLRNKREERLGVEQILERETGVHTTLVVPLIL